MLLPYNLLPSRRGGLPHINRNARHPTPRQHTNSNNIIQPIIHPIRARLKPPSQQGPPICLRRALSLHIDPGAVVCLDVVTCVRTDLAVFVGKPPVCA